MENGSGFCGSRLSPHSSRSQRKGPQSRNALSLLSSPDLDYPEPIVAGFIDGYRAIENDAEKICSIILQSAESHEVRVRHIIRFTSYYVLHLLWLTHPHCQSGTKRRLLLGRLATDPSVAEPLSPAIRRAEEADLLAGDVPYFWSVATGPSLLHHSGTLNDAYFGASAIKCVVDRLHLMSTEDCTQQVNLLREGLCTNARCRAPELGLGGS